MAPEYSLMRTFDSFSHSKLNCSLLWRLDPYGPRVGQVLDGVARIRDEATSNPPWARIWYMVYR